MHSPDHPPLRNEVARKTKKFKDTLSEKDMNEKYRIMKEKEAKELLELRKTVRFWHDEIKPDYIFLNETRATPFGYLFKSAWKEAYPNESLPKFYRIDPRATPHYTMGESKGDEKKNNLDFLKRWKEFLFKRISKSDARVIVFDEAYSQGYSNNAIQYTIRDNLKGTCVFTQYGAYDENSEGHSVWDWLNQQSKSEGRWPNGRYVNEKNLSSGIKLTSKIRPDEIKSLSDLEFRGKILKTPQIVFDQGLQSATKRQALDYMHDLKVVGKEIGEEIRQEQKNKSLENKVTSAIVIAGFASSLLFLSSNITGNAIADLSVKTSSAIGIVLFAIALIAGFFWLRNKKR